MECIDFIRSIFKDRSVISSISNYFNNTELLSVALNITSLKYHNSTCLTGKYHD